MKRTVISILSCMLLAVEVLDCRGCVRGVSLLLQTRLAAPLGVWRYCKSGWRGGRRKAFGKERLRESGHAGACSWSIARLLRSSIRPWC